MNERVYIVGLMISCPVSSSDKNCPFNQYREQPIPKLNKLAEELSPDEIINLSQHHKKCLNQKISSFSSAPIESSIKTKTTPVNLPIYHCFLF